MKQHRHSTASERVSVHATTEEDDDVIAILTAILEGGVVGVAITVATLARGCHKYAPE